MRPTTAGSPTICAAAPAIVGPGALALAGSGLYLPSGGGPIIALMPASGSPSSRISC